MTAQSPVENPLPPTRIQAKGTSVRNTVVAVATAVTLLVTGAIALLWLGPLHTDTVSRSFTEDVDRIVVEVVGEVSIASSASTDVTVERRWGWTGTPETSIDLTDGTLAVDGQCRWFSTRCQASVAANVPAGTEVVVRTAAGDVTVVGTQGGVDVSTSAGAIHVEHVAGGVVVETSAGGIDGIVDAGDVRARTSAGSIDLTAAGDFSSLSAITSAGSVVLAVPDLVFDVEADTSAGRVSIDVRTDPASDRSIRAESSAGDVTVRRVSVS